MSTGLTWVMVLDRSADQPDFNTSPVQFSDYSEAYAYASWIVKLYESFGFASATIRASIYTTSPNDNGWFYADNGSSIFVIYD